MTWTFLVSPARVASVTVWQVGQETDESRGVPLSEGDSPNLHVFFKKDVTMSCVLKSPIQRLSQEQQKQVG